ncbi:TonB-dependent receptor plug [Parvibaculum lavamentivorans DS-1]|uniref:TonB-dependent receptor plug n=1 Tax=Parvibaculum lavamentivorans (strain DS-1 / DSM 13023 / NCIMB 13966) TaxID=402881 RepID=A7HRS9_PARL1|nr:TonB-dependent receptor [Parvibaculum lavamentivorans]ABS62612.1 TonB-dependent receptor plug [Parvibaculum lavamentivorans DS-1]
MSKQHYLDTTSRLALVVMVAALIVPVGTHAQEVVDDDVPVIEPSPAETSAQVKEMTVVSERDKAGLLEQQPSDLLFGMKKPLLETPRSATFVSEETLSTYGVTTVDDLAAVSPGTFTSSFYGVEGALNVRGLLAETYFHGFKRIENRGTYQTPLGATSRIDILRGPPTANFGPGKVGGLLNLEPKTAKISEEAGYMTDVSGQVTGTLGSYDKKNGSFETGIPLNFGNTAGGVFVYGEIEDSESYYRGIKPEHQLLQTTAQFETMNGWTYGGGAMYYQSEGYVQTPGWNRVTQDLIDNGTYITGTNSGLIDANGNGYIDRGELPPGGLTHAPECFGGCDVPLVYRQLDTGVGTTKLSSRDVYTSPFDFSDTTTLTLYGDLIKAFDDGSELKIQAFYDSLDNERFVSYGFPADYDSYTVEGRVSYNFDVKVPDSPLTAAFNVGVSHRYYDAQKKESFNYGGIALDRRDIANGPTPTDTLGSPFLPGSGYTWDYNNKSTWHDTGLFAMADFDVADKLLVTLTGRYDWYSVDSEDTGSLCFCTPGPQSDTDSAFTYSAMALYKGPYGIRPYITYAETTAIEFGQAGDVSPTTVANGDWLSDGDLVEAGIKLEAFDGVLTGALAAYRQHRTVLDNVGGGVDETEGQGVELELRYLATENLSFTFAGNVQKTKFLGSYDAFYYFTPATFGYNPADYYGAGLVGYSFSGIAAITGDSYYAGEIEDRRIPEKVLSLFGTYTTDQYGWGHAGTTWGVRYVSETAGLASDPVRYPDYFLVQASAYADLKSWRIALNVDNVFDEEYFTPLQDLYGDVAVLPGKGREWRVTATYRF